MLRIFANDCWIVTFVFCKHPQVPWLLWPWKLWLAWLLSQYKETSSSTTQYFILCWCAWLLQQSFKQRKMLTLSLSITVGFSGSVINEMFVNPFKECWSHFSGKNSWSLLWPVLKPMSQEPGIAFFFAFPCSDMAKLFWSQIYTSEKYLQNSGMIEMVANQIEYLCTGQNQCSVVSFPSVLVITLKSRSSRNKDKELFKMWVAFWPQGQWQ